MNCFNHPEQTIVATCQDCSKGLCNECAKAFEIPICIECNNFRFKGEKSMVNSKLMNLLFASIGGGLLGYSSLLGLTKVAATSLMDQMAAAFAGMIFGPIIYSGWRQTSKITPRIFLFLPLIGWILYFAVKFIISLQVGIFTAPYEILNGIRKHILIKKRQK